jgi:hypothetical protein
MLASGEKEMEQLRVKVSAAIAYECLYRGRGSRHNSAARCTALRPAEQDGKQCV